jgi:5-hydroxyisourate hydrolase
MSSISTHVIDVVLGKPAAGIAVHLQRREQDEWVAVSVSSTDQDGRCRDLASDGSDGTYRLMFLTSDYFGRQGRTSLYREITITFFCDGEAHYHLPVLLSDNSYTTYRGS